MQRAKSGLLLRPDLLARVFKGVDVDHPAENYRVEGSAGFAACVLGENGALETKLRPVSVLALAFRGHAELGVEVPLGDTQRDARVQLFFGYALGHRVHSADQVIAGLGFLVEQGSRASRIETERLQEAVPVIGEMIFGQREIRQE